MALPFPSEAWINELMNVVNESDAYRQAAEKWEGDIFFVVEKVPGESGDVYLYMDLWHGECRGAGQFGPDEKSPAFEIRAPLPTWKQVLEGRLDPIRGLTTRRLKLKGNLMKILKSPKAAVELVNCAKDVETTYPQ